MTPTQADRDFTASLEDHAYIGGSAWNEAVLAGKIDDDPLLRAVVSFRLAAEAAAFEKAAAYIEGKGGVIPGATVFIPLITGDNQPCMSGDARDRLHSHKRRQFDSATSALATAIRKLAGEKHD